MFDSYHGCDIVNLMPVGTEPDSEKGSAPLVLVVIAALVLVGGVFAYQTFRSAPYTARNKWRD